MSQSTDYLKHILDEANYFGIDYELVWDVVINKIPPLKNKVEQILSEEL